jgi:2TM domain-containing protein
MEDFNSEKYDRAHKRMKDIKGFYSHLVVYILVNLFLTVAHMGILTPGLVDIELTSWSYFTTPFFWGIGLFFHGLYVFQHKFRFFRDWEERKIKEYMERDEEEFKNTTKRD